MLRRLFMSLVVLPLAVLGLATTSQATGFRLGAHGAKAMGMNGAFAAQADDPSAIYYNAAGITQLEGTQVQGGFTFIYAPGSEFEPLPGQISLARGTLNPTPASPSEASSKLFSLPTLFATKKVGEQTAIGFGLYVPFGLRVDWPDDWDGRNITTFDEIRATYLDFAVAHDLLPWWSVSAGLAYVKSDVRLSRTSYGVIPGTEAVFDFDADGWGVTYDVGTQVRMGDRVKIGAQYRHQAVVEYNGDFSSLTLDGAPFLPRTNATAKLPLPSTLIVGIAVKPTDWWTVEFDWDYTHWSSFQDLALHINTAPDPANLGAIQAGLTAGAPFPNRKWKNTSTYRVGTQFQVSEPLAIRLGYAYINTPIPDETLDPILPDSDRSAFTAGFGYKITKSLTFDFAYEYQYFHERTKNNAFLLTSPPGVDGLKANGTYNTEAHAVVTQLKYAF
ncbi:MAG TPA: outer membrane protein transport protein [Thermodesulfobacteriota bacterium]